MHVHDSAAHADPVVLQNNCVHAKNLLKEQRGMRFAVESVESIPGFDHVSGYMCHVGLYSGSFCRNESSAGFLLWCAVASCNGFVSSIFDRASLLHS